MGNLKPHITEFVEAGMNLLRTPEFAQTLRNCFAKDGCFTEMRGDAMQAAARASLAETNSVEELAAFVASNPEPQEEADVFGVSALVTELGAIATEVEVDAVSEDEADENSDSDSESVTA
jgi:hypothetical protein